jgi:hypothetical protein
MRRRGAERYAHLTGVVTVVLVIVGFAVGGDTPGGDASAAKVATFYSSHSGKEIAAAVLVGLAGVALVFFAASLRGVLRGAEGEGGWLSTAAFGGGVISGAGFMTAATLHFALADYADNVRPVAAQAINAIDNDFFLPFVGGLGVLVLASGLLAIRSAVLPKWLGWVGILIFISIFTPAGFIGFAASGIWLVVVSILLTVRGGRRPVAPAV